MMSISRCLCLRTLGIGSILFASILWGEVRRVPQDYESIQAALDAVQEDDTVLVSLGLYAEELSAPPLRFWMIGDVAVDTGDFPRPVIDPSTLDSAQWRRCMTVPVGCQPTLERLAFHNRAPMFPRADTYGWSGILVRSDLPVTVRHCAFDSTWGGLVRWPPPEQGSSQFYVEDCRFIHGQRSQVASTGRAVVRRSVFLGGRHTGFVSGSDNSYIEECVFAGDSLFSVLWLGGENVVVRDNVFGPIDSCVARVVTIQGAVNGVMEDNLFQDIRVISQNQLCLISVDTSSTMRVRHNQFIRIRTCLSVLDLGFGYSPMNPPVLAEIDSNLFLNMIVDCTWAADKALGFGNYSLVRGNRFLNLSPATVACVHPLHPYEAPPPEFRYNIFQAGDYAIYSPFRTVDAIWNYWGDPTGPYNADFNPNGQGARVDDPVWFDPWCPDTNCSESAPETPSILSPSSFLLSAYPNPFNSTLHLTLVPSHIGIVKVELFDILGRKASEIWHGPLAFRKEVNFDASALTSGIYFARVTDVISRRNLAMAKLVLLK